MTRIEVVGINDAIRSLNKIEPGLRKEFAAEATRIAQPAIEEAQRRYSTVGWGDSRIHGLSRKWTDSNGRKLFPWSIPKARNGVKVRLDADRRRTATILLEQRDAATAILESAGRATANPLGMALGSLRPGHTRILAPSLFSKRNQIESEMQKASLKVIDRVQKELN